MTIIAITAAEFQTAAVAWIGALGTVASIAVPAWFKIKAKIDENNRRLDKHDDIQGVCTKTPEVPK